MSRPLLAQGALYTAGVQLSNVSVVLPFVCAQGGCAWVAGLLFPAFSVGTIVGNSTAPAILHWSRGIKHLVVAAAALMMAVLVGCNAVVASAERPAGALFLITTCAIGVMAGLSSVAFSDVVCTALPGAARGRLLLTQGAAGSVLATATTIVVAPLIFHDGSPACRVHVLWLGAAVLAVAAIVALFLRRTTSAAPVVEPGTTLLKTYRVGLDIARTQPWFRRYALTHLLFVPILLGTTFHTLRAADGDVTLRVLVVTSSVGLVAGSVLWRSVSRKFGVRGMLLGSAALSSIAALDSTVSEFLRATANTWLQIVIILLATMAGQAVFTAAISWIGAFADERHRATLIGFAAAMVATTSAAVGVFLSTVAQLETAGWPVVAMLGLNVAAGCMAMRAPDASGSVEPREDVCQNVVDGDVDLLAGRQVLDPDGARLDIAVSGDQSDRRTGAVRRTHRTLDTAVAVREVDAHTRGTQPRREDRQRDLGLLTEWHGEHVDAGRTADSRALSLQRQHRPVHTETKTDAGQILSA